MNSKSGSVVMENIPIGTTIGIDLKCWNIDDKFKGFNDIPPGLHFIFFNSNDKHGDSAIRCGFFEWFNPGEVIFKKWDSATETLISAQTPNEDCQTCETLQMYQGCLAPYPFTEIFKKWLSLTNYISKCLFNRLNPRFITACPSYTTQKFVSSSTSKSVCPMPDSSASIPMEIEQKIDRENELNNLLNLDCDYEIKYTNIPKRMLHPSNCTAGEITKHNIDATFTMESIIGKISSLISSSTSSSLEDHNNNAQNPAALAAYDLLGELQFAFICFMYGHQFESFDQWKKLVLLLCNSETAIQSPEYTQFYIDFIGVLYYHVQEIPGDFFIDICESPNQHFLINTLSNFFDALNDTEPEPGNNNGPTTNMPPDRPPLPISNPTTTAVTTSNNSALTEDRKKLVIRAKNFKRYLRKSCGYKFKKFSSTKYNDDEAPTVVIT